jgi:uncharacterized protein (DUF1697 family)
MIYAALLRGINVGGNNKIDMKLLKDTFLRVGMEGVKTYINSGNVIFIDNKHPKLELPGIIELAILEDFKLDIKVLVRSVVEFEDMMSMLPESWGNNEIMKSDVLFLSEDFDRESVLGEIILKPEIDTALYAPGAILWSVSRSDVTKSGMQKLIGTKIYKAITIRNVNTARKIFEIMKNY